MRFLDGMGLADAQKLKVLAHLRVLWTHHTTALEGNTLTEGDTRLVLEEGDGASELVGRSAPK